MLKEIKNYSREILFSVVFSLCFTSCSLGGMSLERLGTVWGKYNLIFALFVYGITFFVFFLLLKLLPLLEKFVCSVPPIKCLERRFFRQTWQSFAYCLGFLVLCHLPAFLAYFPGIFTYDVSLQAQFFIQKDFLEIHPILHNLMVYSILLINQKFNSGILGILVYTVFQVTTVLSVFAYCIRVLSKYKTPFVLKLGALLFFAFYPTNQVFPLITTKDVLFSVFVLLQILLLVELSQDKEKFLNSNIKFYWFVVSTLLVLLFRHNGLYAYILVLPLLSFFYIKIFNLDYRKILVMFLLPVLLYGTFSVVKRACGIKPPSLASSLAIPIQQLGRVRLLHDKVLSEIDKETYRKIIPPQNEFSYFPICVDFLKFDHFPFQHSDYIEQSLRIHPEYFAHLYFKWARLYPKAYVDAFLLTNYGFWYPFVNYNNLMHQYLYTDTLMNSLFGIPVRSYGMFPPLRLLYNRIFRDNQFEKNIFTRLLFSIGMNTWYLITAIFLLMYQRRYSFIMPLLLPLGLLFTVMFGPTVMLRYVYQNFLILPLLIVFCIGWDGSK